MLRHGCEDHCFFVYNSEVKRLTELEELNVSGNQLTTLPPSLGRLKKLVVLRVHSNSLHSLPNFHDAASLRVSTYFSVFNNTVTSCICQYYLSLFTYSFIYCIQSSSKNGVS